MNRYALNSLPFGTRELVAGMARITVLIRGAGM